ncbi:alcohol dehydrogenase GroES-like domain-containing protein [Phlyctema vagabunda]|uniref:Alcohol dehydrogenase GroES-like domain-containing protein n=1 Tax=Phlyctema vagabunda TaxID=108571 RepID=A0ABR4PY93_9HELO
MAQNTPTAGTMKAVIFDGPGKVSVQDRPIPQLQAETDIIVKVNYSALCGSELHVFRGHQKSATGFIMGHEFTGTVKEAGSQVKTVNVGDKIVSPFTVSTTSLECFYCKNGFSSRCVNGALFGSPVLDGGQAEYVRVPFADGTVMKANPNITDQALVLLADIFPTGFFGATNAFKFSTPEQIAESTVVVVGCGPVGLCAVIAALTFKPKHLFAVDSVDSRLQLAANLGAEPLNFMKDKDGMVKRIKDVTDGRGADAVIEVVGLSPALRTAFELIRPWGTISSIGVHNGEIPYTGNEAYGKNLRIQMGRCPVRSVFPAAQKLLEEKQHLLGFMFEKVLPLSDAVYGYDIFNKMQAQKVVFQCD